MSIIKSFSVGNGDMFYIKHGNDNFTIIDCYLSSLEDEDKENIIKEIKRESKDKSIKRFISTHPDDDHIGGLIYLDSELEIRNFYCVKNEATKEKESKDFDKYCELRDNTDKVFYLRKGCTRKWLNESSSGENSRGSSGINFLWPDTNNKYFKEELEKVKQGESPNNISIIMKYSMGDATFLWMGDLETDFMENIKNDLSLPKVTILFAPHHGRDSGKIPTDLLKNMNPKIIIIGEAPAENLNYYNGYNIITQNSAGDITFDCLGDKIHIYVSNENYKVDFLNNENQNKKLGKYIGTLKLK